MNEELITSTGSTEYQQHAMTTSTGQTEYVNGIDINSPVLVMNSDYSVGERRKFVLDSYLSGMYPFEIKALYLQKYPVGKDSFDKDVLWVNNTLRKRGENEIENIIERHSERYNYLYKLAVEKGDLRSANLALKQFEDLYKLHKPADKQVNTMKVTNNIKLPSMSIDQLKELLGKNDNTIDI